MSSYGKIAKVREGSAAWEAGIRAGDELVSIDSRPVRDVLDYRYLTLEETFEIEIMRSGESLSFHIAKEFDDDLGLDFEEELFDGCRRCANNCIFCFLHQMPRGLRQSLYVRDDDYRLSFAQGNYITLTNLSDEDMDRICSQRMSTLYISVHATEPELRIRMLRNPQAGRILEQLKRFAEAKITMHAQIVVCPGINDGEHLERSIRDLAELHPWVASIAIVPVGLTKYRERLTPLRPLGRAQAYEVLDSCTRFQKEFKQRLGTRLVFASDEFYLLARVDFPSANAYEGFPQYENGIGGCRLFLDELEDLGKRRLCVAPGRYVLVTGELASPIIHKLADFLNGFRGVEARMCITLNNYLGQSVTVAGLLAGLDVQQQLANFDPEETALIPNIALNEGRFLDGMTIGELEASVPCRVVAVPTTPNALMEALVNTYTVSDAVCAGT